MGTCEATLPTDQLQANTHRVLMFVWVLLFRKLIATALCRYHIHRVLRAYNPKSLWYVEN